MRPLRRLTDFGGDEKFVKEIAEAMPSGRAAVFALVGKRPKGGAFEGSTTGDGVVFFGSLARYGPLFQSGRSMDGVDRALTKVKEVSLLKGSLTCCSFENYCNK